MPIKVKEKPIRISGKNYDPRECVENDTKIHFCFQHITSKKKYGMEYMFSNKVNNRVYKDLLNFIYSISQSNWTELKTKGKDSGGYETLQLGTLKHDISDSYDTTLTKDTKLIVFRFGGNKYRIIGYKNKSCTPNFNVLGFDFDFSLYNHGS